MRVEIEVGAADARSERDARRGTWSGPRSGSPSWRWTTSSGMRRGPRHGCRVTASAPAVRLRIEDDGDGPPVRRGRGHARGPARDLGHAGGGAGVRGGARGRARRGRPRDGRGAALARLSVAHPVASGDWLGIGGGGMGDIEALRGVWNIVPTPFTPDGAVDTASIPGLVGFVRGTGVDGMTILGVLGEAGRLGDAERTAVLETVLAAAAGSIPVCVGVSHASTDRAIALAREAQAAGPTRSCSRRPRWRAPPTPRCAATTSRSPGAIDLPVVVQDHPASSGVQMTSDFLLALADEAPRCRVIKLEEEPTPPKAGRLVAGSPDVIVLGGLGGRDAARGAPPRQPRDDDRVRVPGGAGRRGPALVRGRPGRRGRRVRPLRDADPVREPGAAQPADPQGRLPAARGDGPRDGAGAGRAARPRDAGGPGRRPAQNGPRRGTSPPAPCCPRCSPEPGAHRRYGSARIIPPSTGTIAPVTNDAAGESRNAPTRPISAMSP